MASGQHEAKSKSAEEEPVKPKPKRMMIEFENLTFILQDFVRARREMKVSNKFSTGIEYILELDMASHPFIERFSYDTLELRERAYELLRMKLQDLNIVFHAAKPTELPEIEENTDN